MSVSIHAIVVIAPRRAMSRTIIVAGCLGGGSARSIRRRGPARRASSRPHRRTAAAAAVGEPGDAERAIAAAAREEEPTGLRRGSASPVSPRDASIPSAGCCSPSSRRCDDKGTPDDALALPLPRLTPQRPLVSTSIRAVISSSSTDAIPTRVSPHTHAQREKRRGREYVHEIPHSRVFLASARDRCAEGSRGQTPSRAFTQPISFSDRNEQKVIPRPPLVYKRHLWSLASDGFSGAILRNRLSSPEESDARGGVVSPGRGSESNVGAHGILHPRNRFRAPVIVSSYFRTPPIVTRYARGGRAPRPAKAGVTAKGESNRS